MRRFDAVIIGGGPAGATAGCLLARAGWSVAIVEKSAYPRRKVCGEFVGGSGWALLERLRLSGRAGALAGQPVGRVGFFAGNLMLDAPMPNSSDPCVPRGRAIRRENLDTLLLSRAREYGAEIYQPWSVRSVRRADAGFTCRLLSADRSDWIDLNAHVVVSAQGSWVPAAHASRPTRPALKGFDLLAFKAHFRSTRLAPGLMPLIAFPGGYAGMVEADEGIAALSLCVRRDTLAACRRKYSGLRAGDALLEHIREHSRGVREVLQSAALEGAWLSAGPVRPGIRRFHQDGVFLVGNAAGEAHPAIAEGIGMAMASSALLAPCMIAKGPVATARGAQGIADRYEKQWRSRFLPRMHASSVLAQLAMRPVATLLAGSLAKPLSGILTFGARLSGKADCAL